MSGRTRARLCAEEGSMLVEVMVGAVLVVLIGIGVLNGLDRAAATSGTNKSRVVAANLAQQDQERLRSFKAVQLSNRRETHTENVGGVNYSVDSRAEWVTDSNGSISCLTENARADYIKITSSVSWPAMQGVRPVRAESIVAVPVGSFGTSQGGLSIRIRDRAGGPVVDMPVSATRTSTLTDQTNELGCTFFGFLAVGTYQVEFSRQGWVDNRGQLAIDEPASVSGGSTRTVTYDYDRGATITARFDTKVADGAPQPAQAETVSVTNTLMPSPGRRTFGTGAAQASIGTALLFPFTQPYGVYSGNCTGADPTNYIPNYFSSNPGLVSAEPGGVYDVTLREPALNIQVTGPTGTPLSGARVRVTARATGCSTAYTFTTNASGALPEPGLPFGTYDVCAQFNFGGGTQRRTVTGIANTDPAGTAVRTIPVPASGSSGTCP